MNLPSFPHRGLHLDLRIQAMPIRALRALAEESAEAGLNTLLIEWEATFPFRKHAIISNSYAYTRQEIDGFIRHCSRLGIAVIPLQQCFGHVEYILRHARYASLRESTRDFCQVCACRLTEAGKVFGEIFTEIAAVHPSPFLHIGGDETYLLGNCPACRSEADAKGKSLLYINYVKTMVRLVTALGKRPLLWADMLLKYPEAVAELPRDTVFVDWNYGWKPDHFGDQSKLRQTGCEIWGAAALRCHPDNHSSIDWQTHFENLRDFIPFVRKSDYRGMILTSWSTSGIYGHHWDQPGEVIDLLPMRRVYPLSGFRILRAAFAEALRQAAPLDPEAFTVRYAADRFGFSLPEGRRLWKALTVAANPKAKGSALRLASTRAARAKRLLHGLQPTRNRQEFDHFRLMADFQDLHLRFRLVEEQSQSKGFTPAKVPSLHRALANLLREADRLQPRYARLNRGFIYPAEIAAEHAYRVAKIKDLHDRLARTGRQETGA